jgi:hypothetical protein
MAEEEDAGQCSSRRAAVGAHFSAFFPFSVFSRFGFEKIDASAAEPPPLLFL